MDAYIAPTRDGTGESIRSAPAKGWSELNAPSAANLRNNLDTSRSTAQLRQRRDTALAARACPFFLSLRVCDIPLENDRAGRLVDDREKERMIRCEGRPGGWADGSYPYDSRCRRGLRSLLRDLNNCTVD
jgi:hypothetical protein